MSLAKVASRAFRWSFPNPVSDFANPYVPLNSPAISDLFDLFNFAPGQVKDYR